MNGVEDGQKVLRQAIIIFIGKEGGVVIAVVVVGLHEKRSREEEKTIAKDLVSCCKTFE